MVVVLVVVGSDGIGGVGDVSSMVPRMRLSQMGSFIIPHKLIGSHQKPHLPILPLVSSVIHGLCSS